MRINFGEIITDLDGEPVKENTDAASPNATLGFVCLGVLTGSHQDMTEQQKLDAFMLAIKIKKHSPIIDLNTDDIGKIKRCVGKHPNVLVVGRAFAMLETSVPDEPKSVE